MSEVRFDMQTVTTDYRTIKELPKDQTLSPEWRGLACYPWPDEKTGKCVDYFKNGSEYTERVVAFQYVRKTCKIIKEMKHGKLVKFVEENKFMFSYKRGPTIPCQYVFLLTSGYMIPLLDDKLDNLHEMIESCGYEGCNLKWKAI
jgi:hypothetical protein